LFAGAGLTGATRQWVELTEPTQQVAIENPANYTLSFAEDGTVASMADCNSASGSYEAGADGSLAFERQ